MRQGELVGEAGVVTAREERVELGFVMTGSTTRVPAPAVMDGGRSVVM